MREPRSTLWVAIADGAKALIAVNEGTRLRPSLRILKKTELDNPPAREQGSDRPGRMPDTGTGQRSAMEETDWHDFAEERFAADFARMLNEAAAAGRFDKLVLIAPDRALGRLRPALDRTVADRLVAEHHKDLTKHPVPEIESVLADILSPAA